MTTLQQLRGDPMAKVSILGRTLTLYGQGAGLGMFLFVATVVLSNLSWRLIPAVGEILQMLLAAIGFYLSAALIGSFTANGVDTKRASRSWL